MKKRSKILIIFIGIILILAFCVGYQYKRINQGLPNKFNVEKYSKGEVVKLDNFEVVVNDIVKVQDNSKFATESSPLCNLGNLYTIDLTIKNITNEQQNIVSFYTGSVLYNYNQESEIALEIQTADVNAALQSQQEINIKLTYNLPKKMENEAFELHFPKELYRNDIERDSKKLMLNQKYVELYFQK